MSKKKNITDCYTFNICKVVKTNGNEPNSLLNVTFNVYEQFKDVNMHIHIFSATYKEELTRLTYHFTFENFNNDAILAAMYNYSQRNGISFILFIDNCEFLNEQEKEYFRLKYS